MKTRLAIFVAALLLLPLAGLFLSGGAWGELAVNAATATDETLTPTLRTSLMLLFYVLLVNHTVKRLTGNSPFSTQRNYFIGMSIASALLGWLLSYLNLFVASWSVAQDNSVPVQILLYTPLFALLAPAVLVTRALLAVFPGVLKFLAFHAAFTPAGGETLTFILLPLALLGLLGGASWTAQLFWLFWLAPLLLLLALQILWNESTIFSGLKSGDWGRIICTAFAGIMVGNLAVATYQMNASLQINLSSPLLAQAGFALFGLVCLQLGDVIAENWRGKSRSSLFTQKKKFPIPVVVKKS
ncbi:MAG: hypothetical protein COS43_07755 [Gallionellales bacterium CG03_land_8_20_14_0_80_55_15]|nr:MAG: hypothetical protein COS43_07755 [Gallionellales bacterium CG03_land_8_20_14_0_80_55_15]